MRGGIRGRGLVIALALAVAGCQTGGGSNAVSPSDSPGPAGSQTASAPAASASASASASGAAPSSAALGWTLVALGDSDADGSGAPSGKGWVDQYVALVQAGTGHRIAASNLAEGGKTSTDLLAEVRSDARVRTAIEGADIVLLGIGGGDLNDGDAALVGGGCKGKACYEATVATFSKNVAAIAAEIVQIRGTKPTVLRAITLPNVLPGAEDVIPPFLVPVAAEVGPYTARGLRDATCTAMTANGGMCIDAVTAFNGPGADMDAYKLGLLNHGDCCYPNEKGQALMAQLLYETGLAPLVT